ncbi:hypothetical protein BKA93DRAFT_491511 [Sparassis latifolia]
MATVPCSATCLDKGCKRHLGTCSLGVYKHYLNPSTSLPQQTSCLLVLMEDPFDFEMIDSCSGGIDFPPRNTVAASFPTATIRSMPTSTDLPVPSPEHEHMLCDAVLQADEERGEVGMPARLCYVASPIVRLPGTRTRRRKADSRTKEAHRERQAQGSMHQKHSLAELWLYGCVWGFWFMVAMDVIVIAVQASRGTFDVRYWLLQVFPRQISLEVMWILLPLLRLVIWDFGVPAYQSLIV